MLPEELMQKLLYFSIFIYIFIILTFICVVLIYVFKAIALHKLCTIYNISEKWLAWIPILNYYLVLKLGERGVSYIFLPIVLWVLSVVGVTTESSAVMMIVGILQIVAGIWWMIIQIQSYQVICKKLDSGSGLFVAGVFFPIFMVFAWGLCMKNVYKLQSQGYFDNYLVE